jgi:arylsulfatase A-like enzyme
MISQTTIGSEAGAVGLPTPDPAKRLPVFLSRLLLSAWCGLVAGLLEVATIVLRKQAFDPDQLYKMSRHFVWLIPLANVVIFLTIGMLAAGIILIWPRHGHGLFTRVMCAMTVLPSMLVAFPRVYGLAWLVVALGLAARFVPLIERHGRSFRRVVMVSFPAAVAVVAGLWASLWIGDRVKQAREDARPLPQGAPNILLIVMDTVAAGHVSLNGYNRATSTTLVELAERGIRFDSARASSSWTLPSHATMFTGRWLHELSVGWFTPLDRAHPMLAEALGDRGYATAGFVANTSYCGVDTGLARGFTHYQDYIFPGLTALKPTVLMGRALDGFQLAAYFAEDWLASAGLLPHVRRLWQSLENDRKGAATVNRELLDWLATRTQPERPFFAFLNYFDAHYPYQLAPGRLHRFGVEPTDSYQRVLIEHWFDIDKTTLSPDGLAFAVNAYDDCIADLDEQLGKLIDELERRGVLERTWLIIASDHGESFGEHAGIFCHGKSLYETELHVPLLVIPPGGSTTKRSVPETVSLRDVATTIADLAGAGAGSPFPGESLARFWRDASPPGREVSDPALSELVPTEQHQRDDWGLPKALPPLGAIKEGEWSYIRREGDLHEELFHLSQDAQERRNLAGDPSARAILQQMRGALDRLTGGPLLPGRFSP